MKKIKNNRAVSFLIVATVYVIAGIIGVGVYNRLTADWWISLLVADAAATVAVFIFSVLFSNASVYDPYWSVQPIFIVILFAIGRELTLLGILSIIVVSIWGIRLTANWAYTFHGLTHQDWRYTMLKEKTGLFYPIINFIGIHMVPTFVVYGCILPVAYVLLNGIEADLLSIMFLLISLCAVLLQGTADIEMHRFRINRNSVFNRNGLWRYSRHPNYLGEILMWWGVGLSAASASNQWYLVIGALANTLLFLFVSIPLADGRQSKKEGFEEYKNQTRMLLPIKK
ncbi:MAG: DUF1295 domain-containing protein [Clostridiales bacterium]|nr:DUF1295 domain-containing protein [Clostridiales bacterium]